MDIYCNNCTRKVIVMVDGLTACCAATPILMDEEDDNIAELAFARSF